MDFIILFAGGQSAQGSGLTAFLPFVLIMVIIYFLMIRPQAKRQKNKQNMLNNLKKGDKVVTVGGIHGTISRFKNSKKIVILKLDKNINITVNRSAVSGLRDNVSEEDSVALEDS